MIRLVFDRSLKGFGRWLAVVRRLHGLAEIEIPDDGLCLDDYGLIEYAVSRNAYVVTADKRMCRGRPELCGHVIVLKLYNEKGKARSYEELATELASKLASLKRG